MRAAAGDGSDLWVHEAEAAHGGPLPRLTKREHEVLTGLASGARNKEIAAELGMSVRTARFHVENIYQKLDVHTRTQAARASIAWGLVAPE
jgi:DNA-binding NarL/FixJ family response regulator